MSLESFGFDKTRDSDTVIEWEQRDPQGLPGKLRGVRKLRAFDRGGYWDMDRVVANDFGGSKAVAIGSADTREGAVYKLERYVERVANSGL